MLLVKIAKELYHIFFWESSIISFIIICKASLIHNIVLGNRNSSSVGVTHCIMIRLHLAELGYN